MKTFGFTDTNDFAEYLADLTDKMSTFNEDDYSKINVVAKYDVMKDVLNSLIKETDLELVSCNDLNDPDWDNYDDAFILIIDPDMNVWVQAAKYTGHNKYIHMDETDTVFIHGEVDSAFVKQNEDSGCIMYEFNIGNDAEDVSDECDGDCENCDYTTADEDLYTYLTADGVTHGFTASKSDGDSYVSYSYHTTEALSDDDIIRILGVFNF